MNLASQLVRLGRVVILNGLLDIKDSMTVPCLNWFYCRSQIIGGNHKLDQYFELQDWFYGSSLMMVMRKQWAPMTPDGDWTF